MARAFILLVFLGSLRSTQAQVPYVEAENEVLITYFDTIVPTDLYKRVKGYFYSPAFKQATIYVEPQLTEFSRADRTGALCYYYDEDLIARIGDELWGLVGTGCADSLLKARPFPFDQLPRRPKRHVAPKDETVTPDKIKIQASFSRVVLDSTRTHAIFFAEFSCEGLCGHGVFHFLRKVDGRWRTVFTKQTWVS